MKYLKEITQWTDAPNTPNHTYIFDESNACIGFIPTGTKKEIIFTQPIKNFAKARRRFVELNRLYRNMKRIPIKPEKITFKDVEEKIDIEPSYVVGQSYDSAKGDKPKEVGGRKGLDPVRYGDWEQRGRCIDF